MSWNFFDVFDAIIDVVELVTSGSGTSRSKSDRKSLNYDEKPQKKVSKRSRYFTEKISAGFIAAAAVLLSIVFKDPLPSENYTQTLIVASLIGTGISGLLFFVLSVMELYYFKNLFKLLLFSISTILLMTSVVLFIYFKSGVFIA
ncbi:branched-chain amino acid ABC transporter substrate-binding protein [Chryseobacterium sp. Tr-659]|uniref:branched-chain amino acid ABC transporter substrate-binding protein n=1 Tax=Chryseobacterium sp. Tr-659 TaxID=2608340 RepID=UPI0014228607|nr:branched-chain amino acid ABC transporter substrate-binding protein [Chryseobacterium sp. Tr-659]NIF06743.1 branched-chain amino acid ABC transporter substrate-binding protein [Chryseobacterium sp. Tr-659]